MYSFSFLQTGSAGYKEGDVPFDQYEWCAQPWWMSLEQFGSGEVGIKRVETERFIRFEYLRVVKKKNGYRYRRSSHWFIRFPFCKNDKEILIANACVGIAQVALTIIIVNAIYGLVDSLIS